MFPTLQAIVSKLGGAGPQHIVNLHCAVLRSTFIVHITNQGAAQMGYRKRLGARGTGAVTAVVLVLGWTALLAHARQLRGEPQSHERSLRQVVLR